jgi:hypothetical protein
MRSKQLANVLIKILGLSILVHAIPSFVTGLLEIMRMMRLDFSPLAVLFSPVVLAVLGIVLIVRSRDIAEFLFKNEGE